MTICAAAVSINKTAPSIVARHQENADDSAECDRHASGASLTLETAAIEFIEKRKKPSGHELLMVGAVGIEPTTSPV